MASLPYEKVGSFGIFQPLPNHAEFYNLPPLIGTPPLMVVAEMAYPELLDHLKINPTLINEWNLFEVDANGAYGFGTRVKNLFKSIAQNVRGFHKSRCYYGNLFQRVHVRIPQLIPIFPYHPQQASNQAQLVNGIKNDIENFRWMVSFLLLGRVELQELSIEFDLFFSKIFTRAMGGDLEEIREFAVYQMVHPIFFDGGDRIRFFLQVMLYRSSIKKSVFDDDLNLSAYHIGDWEEKIDKDPRMDKSVLRGILEKTTEKDIEGVNLYSVIPRFIRNVHIHYHDRSRGRPHSDYDRMLNILFPGICSKIVDCIIRFVSNNPNVRFSTMLEQPPGFQSEEYRFSGPGGGGGSGGVGAGGGRGAGSGTVAGSSSSGVGCRPYHTGSSSSGSSGQIPGGDGGGVAGSGSGVGHRTYHTGSSSSGSGGRPGGDGGGRGGRVAGSGTGSNGSGVGRRTYHTVSLSSGGGRTGGDGGGRGGSGGHTSGDGGGKGGSGSGSRRSGSRFAALSIESDEDN
ncbi:uncharacterized protein LOC132162178 [Corylus avellana]|uniref:uncharacterized protein LOC132162178 n=1 Tax=Corylus avellana TaxID=13451 RepID=UPI00286B1EED|nr:uncharacterized protein LOC132162178 [Corylus avellana]